MSNTQPNMGGLKKYQANKKEAVRHRIVLAIRKMKKEKKEINIRSVAKESGVSTVTIYKYTDLANQIKNLRDKKNSQVKIRYTENYHQTEIINQGLQMKVDELLKENAFLKKRIEVQNGIIHKEDHSLWIMDD